MHTVFFILIFATLLIFEIGISVFLNKPPSENVFILLILIFLWIFFTYFRKDIQKLKELSRWPSNIIRKKKRTNLIIDALMVYMYGFLSLFICFSIFFLLRNNMKGIGMSLYLAIWSLTFASFLSIISSLLHKKN